jgi:hypothetical protein
VSTIFLFPYKLAGGNTDSNLCRSNIVWAADTNYRINMTNDEARPLAENDDYETLFAADQVSISSTLKATSMLKVSSVCQLSLAMKTRGVFKGYHEAPILFRPTYKLVSRSSFYCSIRSIQSAFSFVTGTTTEPTLTILRRKCESPLTLVRSFRFCHSLSQVSF